MIQLDIHTIADAILIVANIGIVLINMQIKSNIAELKVYMYDKFVTREEFKDNKAHRP